jgi:hypothetical protein
MINFFDIQKNNKYLQNLGLYKDLEEKKLQEVFQENDFR